MSSRKRIEWIDCVRAVSMMLIIVGHTYTAGFWQHLIYAINVPIFFVLSGYLTRRKTIVRTAKAGIRTLLVPYGVTALIIFLLSLISLHRHVPGMITTDHWYHYLIAALYGIGTPSNQTIFRGIMIPAIGAVWFLLAMYFGNIIYQLLRKVTDTLSRNKETSVLVGVSIVLAVIVFAVSSFIQLPWSLGPALLSISFYTAGHIIREYHLMDLSIRNSVLAVIGLVLCCWSALKGDFWFNTGYADNPVLKMVGAIGGSYFLMYLFKVLETRVSMHRLAMLGRLALITLAFHLVCLSVFTDTVIFGNHLAALGLSFNSIGIIQDIYRVLLCEIATVILARFKIVRKLFAIR